MIVSSLAPATGEGSEQLATGQSDIGGGIVI